MKKLNTHRVLHVIRWILAQFHFFVFWHTTISRDLIHGRDTRLSQIGFLVWQKFIRVSGHEINLRVRRFNVITRRCRGKSATERDIFLSKSRSSGSEQRFHILPLLFHPISFPSTSRLVRHCLCNLRFNEFVHKDTKDESRLSAP
jgi:hypothetical protein